MKRKKARKRQRTKKNDFDEREKEMGSFFFWKRVASGQL